MVCFGIRGLTFNYVSNKVRTIRVAREGTRTNYTGSFIPYIPTRVQTGYDNKRI